MDEILGRVGGRFRISITDSTMMSILQCAMNKAHESIQSKEGVIERLNEISKFYELAVMQLDGCLKFVQDETDSGLESSDEEVLGDLTEIRDRLKVRLKESELAISEKDRELNERFDNELKLRTALELKERELDSLRANLKLEKTKTEGVDDPVLGNRVSVDDDRDEEFSELKNSVDQQVWNIKQKLGPEYKLVSKRRNRSFGDIKIERMSSDIDILKETMDLAFGKMQSAIFLSELEPIEQQWRWTVEKDAIGILIKGFMGDIGENFKAEVRRREKQLSTSLSKHLSDLMKEITYLHDELEPLNISLGNLEGKISLRTKGGSSAEEDYYGKPDDSVKKFDQMRQLSEEDPEDNSSHYVAKMIKSHESIIRRKSEEMNWPRQEFLRDKGYSLSRKEKDPVSPRRTIQDVVARLENLVKWNANVSETFGEPGDYDYVETCSSKRVCNFNMTELAKSHTDTFEDVWEKFNKISVSHGVHEQPQNEIRMLEQENGETNMRSMILEEIYVTLIKGLMHESCTELCSCENSPKEMVSNWNEKRESYKIEVQIREQIYYAIISGAVNDFGCVLDAAFKECEDAKVESAWLKDHNLEGNLREEISRVLFREICKDWDMVMGRYDAQSLVRERVCQIVFEETFRDMANTVNHMVRIFKEVKNSENCMNGFSFSNESYQCVEYSVKEDVCMIFLSEMSKEWKKEIDAYNFENLIREDIYVLVIVETVKEASTICVEFEAQDHFRILENLTSTDNLNRNLEGSREDILVQKQDLQLTCVEVQENFMQTASSKIKEPNAHLDLVELKDGKLHKLKKARELVTQMQSTSMSVNSKVEQAIEQLAVSKALLSELRSSLGIAAEDIERTNDHKTPTLPSVHYMGPFRLQPEENEKKEIILSDSAFIPIMEFSQLFVDFKCRVKEKLGRNILRLEEAMHYLNPLAELVASLRQKERLYREAFKRRCESLRKAETEVDLLGDQVDFLLGLLEKIYNTLHHYSPVLQQYFEVSDILKMIRNELIEGGLSHKSKGINIQLFTCL